MFRSERRGVCVVATLLLMFHLFAVSGATAKEHRLILDPPPETRTLGDPFALIEAPPVLANATRLRAVGLHKAVREPGHIAMGDALILDLFQDITLTARVERVALDVNQTYTIRGHVEGRGGHVIFTSTEGRTLATITEPGSPHLRVIQQFPGQPHHVLMETAMADLEIFEECPCPHAHSLMAPALAAGEPTIQGDPNTPAEIDVMIVYSPAARTWADNSGGGIHNVIAQSMERASLTMENSGTLVTFRLVHTAEIPYVKSGNANTDLERLTFDNDGFMDEVHDWRNQYGADLVALFEDEPNTGGIAWLLNNENGSPNFGFSLTRVQQAAWTYTHVHEMGHNMGCGHHRDQNSQPGPGLYPYSAGGRWTGNNGQRYCSIMTYQSGSFFADGLTHSRVAHVSNPDINYEGVATGTANDDNARTLRNTKHAVAAYRPTMVSPRFTLTTSVSPIGAGSMLIDPPPDGDGTYASDEPVTLTAIPNVGYELLAWYGDIVGCPGAVSLVVTMNQDLAVSARFDGDPNLTLQITDPISGASVPSDTTHVSLSGVAGLSAAGSLLWTNAANQEAGSVAVAASWTLASVPLATGTNTIAITATNAPAPVQRGWDSAMDATYNSGWSDGQDSGTGYGPWTLAAFGANAGHFIADNMHPRQGLGPKAWGMWANNGDTATAERSLAQPLLIGDSFSVGFQNNWIDPGRSVGVSLRNSDGDYLVEFLFIGGGADYLVNDSLAERITGFGWTDQPLFLTFTRASCTTYELDIDGQVLFGGSFYPRTNRDVAHAHFWNFSAGAGSNYDFFFDALETTTGPGSNREVIDTVQIVRAAAPMSQTIDFPEVADALLTDVIGLVATASSGLPVSFAVTAGPGEITGGTNLSFSSTGEVSVVASQVGDAIWAPAPDVTQSIQVVKFFDINSNDVPDDWELFYFDSLDVVTADSDFDEDGQTDIEEYIAGTDPTDSESFFWVDDMDIVPGFPSEFVLRWMSVSNRIYRVERVLDVVSEYEPVSDDLPATPPINEFTEPAPDSDIFYYRVRVWEAP